MKLKINSSFVIANLVVMPLISIFITYFFLRGNNNAYDYVDTYLKQSKVIKLTIPKLYEEKRERYKFRDGRKGARDYRQFIFYSPQYHKHIAIVSFSDIDLDSKIKYDLDEERRSHIYNYQATIIAYANTIQWNDAKYGMKDLPMPIFVIKSTHLYNNTKEIEYLSFHNAEKVSPEATRQYVEQYLAHFLPEDEFDRLFKRKKK